MAILFTCRRCKEWVKAPESLAGREVCCPHFNCEVRLVVPASSIPFNSDLLPPISSLGIMYQGDGFRVDDAGRLNDRGHRVGHWAFYDRSGQRLRCGLEEAMARPTEEELREWDPAMQEVAARWRNRDQELRLAHLGKLFIRFGNLPKGGRSTNHFTGEKELGVSCYWARINFIKDTYELRGHGDDRILMRAVSGGYGFVNLLITGEHVGDGSDGEPCVRHPKILSRLKWDQERRGFVRTADVKQSG